MDDDEAQLDRLVASVLKTNTTASTHPNAWTQTINRDAVKRATDHYLRAYEHAWDNQVSSYMQGARECERDRLAQAKWEAAIVEREEKKAFDAILYRRVRDIEAIQALIVPGEEGDPDVIAFNDGLRAALEAISVA